MTPELEELERILFDVFRETSTATRLADMAGLDASRIDKSGTPADVWHSIILAAQQDGLLGALVDRARVERPRNTELINAWNAFQAAAAPPAPKVHMRPPRGQAGDDLSDYRADERRDARIDQMQRDMADMRVQMAGLVVQVTALTEMIRNQNEHNSPPSLSNAQFAAIVLALSSMAILIFAAVYYGGNR